MKLVKLLNKKHVGLIVMEYGRIKAGDDRWAGYYALVLQGVWKKEIEEAIKVAERTRVKHRPSAI